MCQDPACSESGCGCRSQSPWPWIDPLDGSRRTHAQQEQRTLGLRYSEPGGVLKGNGPRTYSFGQLGVGHSAHGMLYTTPWGAQAPASGS